MSVTIQLRRGTAAQWTSANPVLAVGEMGVETDTDRFKLGNGTAPWSSLAYGGLPGPTGAQGPQGNPGATGSQGATGNTGSQGPIGNTGSQGPQGNTGAQGTQGIQGIQGIQGVPGPGLTGSAATSATTGTMTVNMTTAVVTITPTGACTFNASGGTAGQMVTFAITTQGTSSFVLTFGTNYRKTGTLATGTVAARYFSVTFICVGANIWQEVSRTAAQT